MVTNCQDWMILPRIYKELKTNWQIINCDMQNAIYISFRIRQKAVGSSAGLQKEFQGMQEIKVQKSDLCTGKL